MQTEIIVSGFGGQGVLLAGQLLAYAGMDTGHEVTWIPSYGPEMRGGTANCTVIISDEEIGSPMVRNPKVVLALNLPSLDKYEHQLMSGGLLVVNAALINREISRKDIQVLLVPANEIAEGLGDRRMTNMVMLGALLANLPVMPLEAITEAWKRHMPARHQKLLAANTKALEKGATFLVEKV